MPTITFGYTNVTTTGTDNSITFGSSTVIWTNWVEQANIQFGTASTCNLVWDTWVVRGSCTANTATTVVWAEWARQTANEHRRVPGVIHAETRRRDAAENERWRLVAEQEKQRRAEADKKAEILLGSLLTAEQREDLQKKRCFYVYSKGKKYRVDRGQHGNVKLVNERDEVVESYCIQPRGGLPDADAMAAQKLLLETDPEAFRNIANVSDRLGALVRHGRAQPGYGAVAFG
jgi:hypothetical protein